MYKQPKAIVFLGPPGSGKGTQAGRLSALLELPAISTGEILRRECQARTELGRKVQTVLQTGRLVADDLMNQLVENRLARNDCRAGCILDGFPRTIEQAVYLDQMLGRLDIPRPTVFDFTISADELIERLERRRQCPTCGRIYKVDKAAHSGPMLCHNDRSMLVLRNDDCPAAIRERLTIHQRNCAGLVRYYERGDYHQVAAARAEADVSDQLLQALGLKGILPRAVPVTSRLASAAC